MNRKLIHFFVITFVYSVIIVYTIVWYKTSKNITQNIIYGIIQFNNRKIAIYDLPRIYDICVQNNWLNKYWNYVKNNIFSTKRLEFIGDQYFNKSLYSIDFLFHFLFHFLLHFLFHFFCSNLLNINLFW